MATAAAWALICALLPSVTDSASWTWTTLDYPGASETRPYGIWGDSVVGGYSDATGMHAFVYKKGRWAALDCPWGIGSAAYGVWEDRIVGFYTAYGPDSTGFLYDGTTWASLYYPPGASTRAEAIFGDTILGYYEGTGYYHNCGFVYDTQARTYRSLTYPGVYHADTIATGVWGNTIVGHYAGTDWAGHGFIYNGSSWRSVSPPDSDSCTIEGIYENSVVGHFQHYFGDSASSSFLYDGTSFTYLNKPGAFTTGATGIFGNQIVGIYADVQGGPAHGFLLTMPEPASLLLVVLAGPLVLCQHRH